MSRQTTPAFRNLAAVRALYDVLAAPRRNYYKTTVRVYWRKGSSLSAIVHTELDNASLSKKGWPHARSVEIECLRHPNGSFVRDRKGEKIPLRFTEFTCGMLYVPLATNTLGSLDYEWALCMKIDADLARSKYGQVEMGMLPYLERFNRREHERPVPEINRGHAPRKTNAEALLEQYGDNPDARAWIESNQGRIDSSEFTHDNYKESVMHDSISLDAFPVADQDLILSKNRANMMKRRPDQDEQFNSMK